MAHPRSCARPRSLRLSTMVQVGRCVPDVGRGDRKDLHGRDADDLIGILERRSVEQLDGPCAAVRSRISPSRSRMAPAKWLANVMISFTNSMTISSPGRVVPASRRRRANGRVWRKVR